MNLPVLTEREKTLINAALKQCATYIIDQIIELAHNPMVDQIKTSTALLTLAEGMEIGLKKTFERHDDVNT